jgi:hypothetical protein
VPRPARLIADALNARVGRPVPLDEIGLTASEVISPELGPTYARTIDEAVTMTSRIWQTDVDDVQQVLSLPPNNGAWSEASLSWLVRSDGPFLTERKARRSL